MAETIEERTAAAAASISACSSASLNSSYATDGVVPCLAPIPVAVNNGLETPETRTPPPRSATPESDTSQPPSERSAPGSCRAEGPLSRIATVASSNGAVEALEKEAENLVAKGEKTAADGEAAPDEEASAVSAEVASATISADPPQGKSTAAPIGQGSGRKGKASRGGKERHANSAPAQTSQEQLTDDGSAQQSAAISANAAPVAIAFGSFAIPVPTEAMGGFAAGGVITSFSDRRIIEALAAPASAHKRLLQTAKRVPEIILSCAEGPALSHNVELYGSLSLDMTEPDNSNSRPKQDWASYYINGRSDVDFVVEVRPDTPPALIAQRLQSKGPWRLVGQTQVHKFASTQYTLFGSFGEDEEDGDATQVYLDVTCVESPLHYNRFKQRQEAFRRVFLDVRTWMEASFSAQGALAFDAYIHLLKAFAAKVPGNALTGFQATCIGLFTLQIGHYRFKPNQSIALALFEGFLRFCHYFFGEAPQGNVCSWHHFHYRSCGIDLSSWGRWIPRQSFVWRSELYFMATEVKMRARPDERVNVVHSLDPARVSAEALALLSRAFGMSDFVRAFAPSPAAFYQPVAAAPAPRPSTKGHSANAAAGTTIV